MWEPPLLFPSACLQVFSREPESPQTCKMRLLAPHLLCFLNGCGGLSLAVTPLIVGWPGSLPPGRAYCSTPQCLQCPVHNDVEVFRA